MAGNAEMERYFRHFGGGGGGSPFLESYGPLYSVFVGFRGDQWASWAFWPLFGPFGPLETHFKSPILSLNSIFKAHFEFGWRIDFWRENKVRF